MSQIELSEFIEYVRTQLTSVLEQSAEERLRLEVGPVELSLSVTAEKSAKPGAKLKLYVIEAGAEATISSTSVQQLKITFSVLDSSSNAQAQTPASPARISGQQAPGER